MLTPAGEAVLEHVRSLRLLRDDVVTVSFILVPEQEAREISQLSGVPCWRCPRMQESLFYAGRDIFLGPFYQRIYLETQP